MLNYYLALIFTIIYYVAFYLCLALMWRSRSIRQTHLSIQNARNIKPTQSNIENLRFSVVIQYLLQDTWYFSGTHIWKWKYILHITNLWRAFREQNYHESIGVWAQVIFIPQSMHMGKTTDMFGRLKLSCHKFYQSAADLGGFQGFHETLFSFSYGYGSLREFNIIELFS